MDKSQFFSAVRPELVGDNAPSVRPGDDPILYGSAVLSPNGPVEVRSFNTFKITYTVGLIGLDDTGGIRVCFRMISDFGKLQITNPSAPNFLSADCSGSGKIALRIAPEGQRPWSLAVTAQLNGGYLSKGEKITITFGDTSHGSPGFLMQTFAEGGFEFRVMTDVQATGNFLPLEQQFTVPVVAGPATKWVAVLPTLRRPGENFFLGLKAEDLWGNPTNKVVGKVEFKTSVPVRGLPTILDYTPEDRALIFQNLSVAEEGTLRIKVFVDGEERAEAGPLIIQSGDRASFWGDLHGQTGETVGVNTIESYFDFARNKTFLDVSAHQGNDFQINTAFWDHLNKVTAEWNEPGRFTVFPGYEWSGNTAIGGDHNIYFSDEGRAIRRCSHALLEDESEMSSDANTLTDLYSALSGEDAVIYAHVGGRYANIHYDHDPILETAVEMHSAWGTFEWVLTDGFPLGRRVGVVCNSDGHKGRPGASYPGASTFGSLGGLTCFLTDRNDRASIMEAQRRRHHYGTTGCRMYMDVTAKLSGAGQICTRNPAAAPDSPRINADKIMMGDIVETSSTTATISISVEAHSGIEKIELRNGHEILRTFYTYNEADLGHRYRVKWSGAEYRGRGRNTKWSGQARFDGANIQKFETINQWNPENLFEQRGSDSVIWKTITTGNFMGFDAWLNPVKETRLRISTNHGQLDLGLNDIGHEATVLEAGGLERKLSVQRLPDNRLPRTLNCTQSVPLTMNRDDPIWIAVTTEDGFQAWSSPIYFI